MGLLAYLMTGVRVPQLLTDGSAFPWELGSRPPFQHERNTQYSHPSAPLKPGRLLRAHGSSWDDSGSALVTRWLRPREERVGGSRVSGIPDIPCLRLPHSPPGCLGTAVMSQDGRAAADMACGAAVSWRVWTAQSRAPKVESIDCQWRPSGTRWSQGGPRGTSTGPRHPHSASSHFQLHRERDSTDHSLK